MLKIKDNVDLKELEKFGFKPRYDEDTGELKEYFYVNKKETSSDGFLGIFVKKEQITKKVKIRFTFLRDKFGVPKVKDGRRWILDNYRYYCTDLDKIYDLIQAGLVEKVGDIE